MEDYIWHLVLKKIASEASGPELSELDDLLLKDNAIRKSVTNFLFDWYRDKTGDHDLYEHEIDVNLFIVHQRILKQITSALHATPYDQGH